ncbi:MAG: VanZ family protein [Flavobacteriaceae bacterium]|nr:VanZ family protein [Flavobacteriaceae bacterium]
MLQRIKKLLEHNALYFAVFNTVIIAVLSLTSLPKIDLGLHIKSNDKYLHAFAYFTLTFVWLFVFRKNYHKNKFKLTALILLTIYGIILEGMQGGLTSYRTADMYDAVANFIGVMLALILFKKFIFWYNKA